MQVVIILVLVAACSAQPVAKEWIQFVHYVDSYGKPYANDSVTMEYKYKAFLQSLERHAKLNHFEKFSGGTAVYGVNKFSDLTPKEFQATYLSKPRFPTATNTLYQNGLSHSSLPNNSTKWDWRDKGIVTPVKDQKKCGSCWAFSVVETLESAWASMNHKSPVKLSPQQILSCEYDVDIDLDGCEGGILYSAFNVINNSLLVVPESDYPFTSGDGSNKPCKTNLPNKGVMLTHYFANNRDSPVRAQDLQRYVYQYSTTSNSANANMWQDYISGIIQHNCNASFLDHAVQIVGYDMTGDVPFWIVRNTWGSDWGEDGYLRVVANDNNVCGLASEVMAVVDTKTVNL